MSLGYTEWLQELGVEVSYGIGPVFDDWIRLNGHAVALAVLSRPAVADRYIGPLRRYSRATIAYYGHDLHFQRLAMQAQRTGDAQLAAEAAAIEETERSVWRRADVVLYPSPEEIAVAKSVSARAAAIIPYAYDDFGDGRRPAANHEILFVAGFAHAPNADAASWLAGEIMPLISERVPDAQAGAGRRQPLTGGARARGRPRRGRGPGQRGRAQGPLRAGAGRDGSASGGGGRQIEGGRGPA